MPDFAPTYPDHVRTSGAEDGHLDVVPDSDPPYPDHITMLIPYERLLRRSVSPSGSVGRGHGSDQEQVTSREVNGRSLRGVQIQPRAVRVDDGYLLIYPEPEEMIEVVQTLFEWSPQPHPIRTALYEGPYDQTQTAQQRIDAVHTPTTSSVPYHSITTNDTVEVNPGRSSPPYDRYDVSRQLLSSPPPRSPTPLPHTAVSAWPIHPVLIEWDKAQQEEEEERKQKEFERLQAYRAGREPEEEAQRPAPDENENSDDEVVGVLIFCSCLLL
ncbi:hypothetical protein QFC21_006185 [Naganishia friedmannii]|uniref:Uncharacterized protein n=1 Tax=Naganishia friedmannii TaxID=89922 RepID=A0ACC2V4G5_9TREE|nr:hypothetical protein QFC21_006185 [Naganishia friedmannii]